MQTTRTLHAFTFMSLLSIQPAHSAQHVKILTHPKMIATSCALAGAACLGARHYVRQSALKTIQATYQRLAQRYAQAPFAYAEEELAQRYVDRQQHRSTIAEYHKDVQQDRVIAEKLYTACTTGSLSKALVPLLPEVTTLTCKLQSLENNVAQAIAPLDLFAIFDHYVQKFGTFVESACSGNFSATNEFICTTYHSPEYPYPYLLCHQDIEQALIHLETTEKHVAASHATRQQSQQLREQLERTKRYIMSLPLYLDQQQKAITDQHARALLKTQQEQTATLHKQLKALKVINTSLSNMHAAQQEEVDLLQQLQCMQYLQLRATGSPLRAKLTFTKNNPQNNVPQAINKKTQELSNRKAAEQPIQNELLQQMQHTMAAMQQQIQQLQQVPQPPASPSAPVDASQPGQSLYPRVGMQLEGRSVFVN